MNYLRKYLDKVHLMEFSTLYKHIVTSYGSRVNVVPYSLPLDVKMMKNHWLESV